MEFLFDEVESLPKLAWVVLMRENVDTVTVQHGPWVEASEDFFVEGAWSGDFAAQSIESTTLMGSGGKITEDGLLLATPNHTLDRIYVYKERDSLVASNSLPFLLSRAEDDLDMSFLFYDALLASIIDGLEKYERVLPTEKGIGVHLYYHCNLHISSDLTIAERPKAAIRDFSDYLDYTGFLEEQVAAICANAGHASRKVRYSPVTTISSGYDSPACAVLARNAGCQVSLTIAEARGDHKEDSGHLIAEQLGLEVKTFERLAYRRNSSFLEAECSGGPTEFSSLADDLAQTILFVGFHGGEAWNIDSTPSRSIVRGDASGFGLTELRLRTGFIQMAIPFIGCTSHPSIHRISNSAEMRPWSLGNRYDRPIPRRLVEECGVDRQLFGMQKKAAGVFVTQEGIQETLSERSFRDFSEFCETYWRWSFGVKSGVVRAARSLAVLNKRASRVLGRVIRRATGLNVKIPILLPRPLRIRTYGYAGREALLLHWGVRKMMLRYVDR